MLASSKSDLSKDLEEIRLKYQSQHPSLNEQRKYLRTYYEDEIPILLRLRDEKGEFIQPLAFLINESFKGLGLFVFTDTPLSSHQLCEVNFLDTEWISARIVWSQFIGESWQEIGITYRF